MNNQYFSLNQTGRLWDRIVQTRNFSLFIPPEIADAQPEILVVLP
jgi:predicted component of type VI protein secretion system